MFDFSFRVRAYLHPTNGVGKCLNGERRLQRRMSSSAVLTMVVMAGVVVMVVAHFTVHVLSLARSAITGWCCEIMKMKRHAIRQQTVLLPSFQTAALAVTR